VTVGAAPGAAAAAAGAAGAAVAPDGVAALLVWAKAEIATKAAAARRVCRNLLFIGSIELLGTGSSARLRE